MKIFMIKRRSGARLSYRRTAVRFRQWTKALLAFVLVECILLNGGSALAAPQPSFASASNAITTAFVATYDAGQSGGNVSQLVSRLNIALNLVQQAQEENATNPTKATQDLQNATLIAEGVTADSASVAQLGREARQTTEFVSLETAYLIVVVAGLTYLFGDRLYARLWALVYRDYTVRPQYA